LTQTVGVVKRLNFIAIVYYQEKYLPQLYDGPYYNDALAHHRNSTLHGQFRIPLLKKGEKSTLGKPSSSHDRVM